MIFIGSQHSNNVIMALEILAKANHEIGFVHRGQPLPPDFVAVVEIKTDDGEPGIVLESKYLDEPLPPWATGKPFIGIIGDPKSNRDRLIQAAAQLLLNT